MVCHLSAEVQGHLKTLVPVDWVILGSWGRAFRASVDTMPGVSVSSDSVFRDAASFYRSRRGSQDKCLWWAGKEAPRIGLAGAQVALSLALQVNCVRQGGSAGNEA